MENSGTSLGRWIPHGIAATVLIILAALSCLFFRDVKKRFPFIPPGAYLGAMNWDLSGSANRPLRFYLESEAQGEAFLVVVFRKNWAPLHITSVVSASSQRGARQLIPLVLSGPDGRWELTGKQIDADRFAGELKDLDDGQAGNWTLGSIVRAEPADSVASSDLRLRLLLKSELGNIEQMIKKAEKDVLAQREEIEKLTELLVEGEKLKGKANEKYKAAVAQLNEQELTRAARQEAARKLEASFDISQRVTPMGKLAVLSRESLEREWRWVDSMLRSHVEERSDEFSRAVENGARVSQLREAIALEQARIDQLRLAQEEGDGRD